MLMSLVFVFLGIFLFKVFTLVVNASFEDKPLVLTLNNFIATKIKKNMVAYILLLENTYCI